MLVTKGSREDAIHAMINTWLKFPFKSCGVCGKIADGEACCDKPFIGTNWDIMRQFLRDQHNVRSSRSNKWASNTKKTQRWLLSFPPGLLEFLERSMMRNYEEKLFTSEHSTAWFAKKFPQFSIPEEV